MASVGRATDSGSGFGQTWAPASDAMGGRQLAIKCATAPRRQRESSARLPKTGTAASQPSCDPYSFPWSVEQTAVWSGFGFTVAEEGREALVAQNKDAM